MTKYDCTATSGSEKYDNYEEVDTSDLMMMCVNRIMKSWNYILWAFWGIYVYTYIIKTHYSSPKYNTFFMCVK